MQSFTLFYRGELKSNGNAAHKHEIRSAFHPQLERLWIESQFYKNVLQHGPPGPKRAEDHLENYYQYYCIERGGHRFLPNVRSGAIELDVILLRPGPIGRVLAGGGDIDNRLKTLFDALQAPDVNQATNIQDASTNPFHCLMADDKLVTRVNVRTAQLLDVPIDSREVVLFIDVVAPDRNWSDF